MEVATTETRSIRPLTPTMTFSMKWRRQRPRIRRTLKRKLARLGINRARAERMTNEEPWEPLPGMIKRRCEHCRFWFATPQQAQKARCPDCKSIEE